MVHHRAIYHVGIVLLPFGQDGKGSRVSLFEGEMKERIVDDTICYFFLLEQA